jgi:tRNA(Ile)-lysidine synthase
VSAVKPLKFSSFNDDEIADLFEPLKTLRFLAVAVSGGPDSMALMLMLVAWRAMIGKGAPELCVLSVDHGLRRESAEEIELVARISRKYGLTHKSFSWEGAKSTGNISSKSREARYDLMCNWCAQQQISHLLVAHTLDDQAETVLLRLARGSGVDGLAAMAPSRAWNSTVIYRPLLGMKRSRLVQLLHSVHCPFASDPSNHNPKYDRVLFRQALKILEPLGITSQGLVDTANRLAQAREALDVMTLQAIARSVSIFDAGYCVINPSQLELYPYEIKRRVLGRLLCAVGGHPYAPPHSSLDRLLSWVLATTTSSRTLGGCFLMPRQGKIWVMREAGRDFLPEVLLHAGEKIVWDNRMTVSLSASSEGPLLVKALGVDNYAGIKTLQKSKAPYPSTLGACLPSFWRNQELIAVPHLNFNKAKPVYQIEAAFANSAQLIEV